MYPLEVVDHQLYEGRYSLLQYLIWRAVCVVGIVIACVGVDTLAIARLTLTNILFTLFQNGIRYVVESSVLRSECYSLDDDTQFCFSLLIHLYAVFPLYCCNSSCSTV